MTPLADARLAHLAESPVLLVASDYDGTLAPIVPDPALAAPDPRALEALHDLARLPHTHAAIISGRALADLRRLAGDTGDILLFASHGAEAPDTPLCLTTAQHDLRARLHERLNAAAATLQGLAVELKPAGVALHYRNARDPDAARALIDALAESLAALEGVRPRHGSQVLEFLVVDADKGAALARARHRAGASAVLFLGDDATDEHAFAALRPGDLGVKVGQGESAATLRLRDVADVADLLHALLERRSSWLRDRRLIPLDRCAILSDQRTVAVVAPDARIAWLCLPRLDSSALFAELVDTPASGYFQVGPAEGGPAIDARYDADSFTLVTRWPSLAVTDYLDATGGRAFQKSGRNDLYRVLEGRGQALIRFAPRLDFGRVHTRLATHDAGLVIEGSPEPVVLVAPGVRWTIHEDGPHHTAHGIADLDQGPVVLELRFGTANLRPSPIPEPERRAANRRFWQGWAATLRLPSVAPDLVRRSALVIKALCHGPTGAIAAAATTSLPEHLGGSRNWDYRFCWPRDAAMAAAALLRLGNSGHALRFLDWMLGVVERADSSETLRPIYSLTGAHLPPEADLTHLAGYAGSRPVRVSNAAAGQVQLDVYAPIVHLIALLADRGDPVTRDHWRLVRSMVDGVQAHWHEPDHGIWEMRTQRLHHVHSKVMCWHTLDRALVVEEALLGRQSSDWIRLREQVREHVLAHGYNPRVAAFTGAYGHDYPDAAALAVGLTGLLPRDDPRWASTVDFVLRNLRDGPVVRRYRADDGLPGDDPGFHLCTGWLIEALLTLDRRSEARELFDLLAAHARGPSILTEAYDPRHRLPVGNLAQVYSHLAIINAALALDAADRSAR